MTNFQFSTPSLPAPLTRPPSRLRPSAFRLPPSSPRSAFSLIEVLLALAITVGMMIVILFFYQQTARVRAELLAETERLATVRLVLDRLSADLRTAKNHDPLYTGLFGASDFLQLIKTDRPGYQAWQASVDDSLSQPNSDLKRVGYVLTDAGLLRWEEPFLESMPVPDDASSADGIDDPPTRAGPEPPEIVDAFDAAPPIEAVQFLRLRYYDGYQWWDTWDFLDLPLGVEILVGLQRWEPEDPAEPYPHETFQRILHLPGSMASFDPVAAEFLE